MRADLWLAVTQDACPSPFQPVAGGDDVVDFIADVMDTAVCIALEKFGDRGVLSERFQQLDLGVGQFYKHGGDSVRGLRHSGRDLRRKCIPIDARRGVDVTHRDGHVVQPSNHRDLHYIPADLSIYTVSTCTRHSGFLPQLSATAERTAPRTACATASGSRRRGFGNCATVSATTSSTILAMLSPSMVCSGMPINSTSGSATMTPF